MRCKFRSRFLLVLQDSSSYNTEARKSKTDVVGWRDLSEVRCRSRQMGQANHLGFSIEQATMKINTTAIGIFILVCCSLILVCCSLVLSQPKAPQSPNASMFPCPGNYLYVPASYLIANRTDYAMPIYPPIAVQAKIQGDVVLKVLID